MKVFKTEIPEVLLIEPRVFEDERGFFFESFNERAWDEATGLNVKFVQDNHSRSTKGVLRGLHYQSFPAAQAKLVRCVVGEVFDVAVDIRHNSETFGRWVGQRLSSENKLQMWIPEGFAHGFLVLSDVAEILYKTTSYYNPDCEGCIVWNDSQLSIEWPVSSTPPVLSEKDTVAPKLVDIIKY